MSDEYVSKADAIGAIWHSIDGELFGELESCAHAVIGDADNAIESLEPADVVPVRHGKWTHKPDVYGVVYCSECNYELHANSTSFCPNCGARMDGERKE